jgi:hypothetical protein
MSWITIPLLWVTPAAVLAIVFRLPRIWAFIADKIAVRRALRHPSTPPLERLAADLRRLTDDLERIELADPPHKMVRMRATMVAYDDTLLIACRSLGVDTPRERGPLDDVERLQTEAALVQQGMSW